MKNTYYDQCILSEMYVVCVDMQFSPIMAFFRLCLSINKPDPYSSCVRSTSLHSSVHGNVGSCKAITKPCVCGGGGGSVAEKGGPSAIRTPTLSVKEKYLMPYNKASASTAFATEAAGIVDSLVHISALCSLSSNSIKGKARDSYRRVILIHHIVVSSMVVGG